MPRPSGIFFNNNAVYGSIHSFPTRRSSDLSACPVRSGNGLEEGLSAIVEGSTRSEEHTSELQSRGHLVCRLLLEKKNTATRNSRRPARIRRSITDRALRRSPAASPCEPTGG